MSITPEDMRAFTEQPGTPTPSNADSARMIRILNRHRSDHPFLAADAAAQKETPLRGRLIADPRAAIPQRRPPSGRDAR